MKTYKPINLERANKYLHNIINIGGLGDKGISKLYSRFNRGFLTSLKILAFDFDKNEINFRIFGLDPENAHLALVGNNGRIITKAQLDDFYNKNGEVLTRLGFGREIFSEFKEKVVDLKEALERRVKLFRKKLASTVKQHREYAPILKIFAVDITGVMEEEEFNKVSGAITVEDLKMYKNMISQEEFKKTWTESKGGKAWNTLIGYTTETLTKIHREYQSQILGSREKEILRMIYNRGVKNIKDTLVSMGYEKQLHEFSKPVFRNLPMHIPKKT